MGCLPNFSRLKFMGRRSITQEGVAATRDDVILTGFHIKEKDFRANTYSWNDLERLTMNFSRVIGSGGFGMVFLARFSSLTFGAVKVHGSSGHHNRLFKQELNILLQLHHRNIVKLLGYCDDQERGALVLEYVGNGSLQDKLHGAETQVLSWKRRMVIAFQLAEALEYLHEKCNLQIIHGDIKASNILLDEHLDCKLCDFGSAKMGFSSMVMPNYKQVMMGSPGYTDPHYMRTGIASKKNDIYSYGVIILELVTGMEAFCEETGQLLTSRMGPMIKDAREDEVTRTAEMVDPRLAGDVELKEARAMLSLSALCLRQSPVLRPSAAQILHEIREKLTSISFLFATNKESQN